MMSLAATVRKKIPYDQARPMIHDADVLLFRGDKWYQRIIGIAGRSHYCHVGLAAWWHGRVHVLQQTGFGDHKPLLSELLRTTCKEIDVYEPVGISETQRLFAVKEMIEIVGQRYGWRNLLNVAMLHVPIVRGFVMANTNDAARPSFPPSCSAATTQALRRNWKDPVPNLADSHTEPADLARSGLLKYKFTLSPEAPIPPPV
jgi:hypothetical protein